MDVGKLLLYFSLLWPVFAHGHESVLVNVTGCGFVSTLSLEEMKYLFKFIYSFLSSGVETKGGVKLTCNA